MYKNTKQNPGRPKPSADHGITLTELMIALTIVGIIAAAAILAFSSSHQHARLQHAADRLAADLRWVAAQARRDQKPYEVIIDTTARSYYANGVKSLNGKEQMKVDLAAPPYEISSIVINFSIESKVAFDAQGHVSPYGNIVLRSGNKAITININEMGHVEQK